MLDEFLARKPLYYNEIDYTRMPRVYKSIQKYLKLPKIIHLIGTNGKGTTGRFLATALYANGYSIGHYTSPHILSFNERIWMNGSDITDEELEFAHAKLLSLLSTKDALSLSYFEYTTLLAIYIYQEVDYLVLEAGLGGEHDATSVFKNELTLVTTIDMDHESFLGDSVEKIATTKLNAIQKNAIIGFQKHKEIDIVVKKVKEEKKVKISGFDHFLTDSDEIKIKEIALNNRLAIYLENNLRLAIAALNNFGIKYKSEDFNHSKLFGRLSQIEKNIVIDVGHNVLAAQSIYDALKEDKYTLVYNSYKDKNYKEILYILKPLLLDIEILEIDESRIESTELMELALEELGFEYKKFVEIDDSKNYLVFGSFSVVEKFLKEYGE